MHAVWIPPWRRHGPESFGSYAGWNVYIAERCCAAWPAQPCALRASALLKAAIERVAGWPQGPQHPSEQRLAQVLIDEIAVLPRVPLELPSSADLRPQRVTQQLLRRPGNPRTLAEWATMSARTFARLIAQFRGEFDRTPGEYAGSTDPRMV